MKTTPYFEQKLRERPQVQPGCLERVLQPAQDSQAVKRTAQLLGGDS